MVQVVSFDDEVEMVSYLAKLLRGYAHHVDVALVDHGHSRDAICAEVNDLLEEMYTTLAPIFTNHSVGVQLMAVATMFAVELENTMESIEERVEAVTSEENTDEAFKQYEERHGENKFGKHDH